MKKNVALLTEGRPPETYVALKQHPAKKIAKVSTNEREEKRTNVASILSSAKKE